MITCTNLCRIMRRERWSQRWWRQHPGKARPASHHRHKYMYICLCFTRPGGLPLLSPLSRLVGEVPVTSSTHIPPFCPLSIIWEWRAAKMATAVSAHFELQKCSSETYGWHHGHYVHVFYMVTPKKKKKKIYIYIYIWWTPWGSGLSIWIETGLWKRGISFLELS